MNPYDYINSFSKFGSEGGFKPGLERVKTLLSYFGHPEEKLSVIHVAGSNGKGSTITFLKSIYQQAEYKVGVYTSPHLVSFNERFEINGEYITTRELERIVKMIAPVVERISNSKLGKLSYFEVITAIGFIYFYNKKVDLLLLEVGLGGRLDATNVISSPLVSVITSISLEHTAILGSTIEDIAREKSGIIKMGRPVLTAVKDKRALKVIDKIAEERSAKLRVIDEIYNYNVKESSLQGQQFSLSLKGSALKKSKSKECFLHLLGEHQIKNALLALAVTEELKDKYPIEEMDKKNGFRNAFIPGRLEVVQENPLIILDGAHNPEGIKVLVQFLQIEAEFHHKIKIILSILGDKNAAEMIELLNFSSKIELIITKNSNTRALDPKIIEKYALKNKINSIVFSNLKEAITYTLNSLQDDDFFCVTGSLYSVGEAKIILETNGIK